MDEEKRLRKARIQIMLNSPFFGSLIEHLDLMPKKDLGTFATDGKYIYYPEGKIDELEDWYLESVQVHEVLHCALGHLWRRGLRTWMRWGVAADYAVNAALKGQYKVSPNWLYDKRWDGMTVEQIYDKLPEEIVWVVDLQDFTDGKNGGEEGKAKGLAPTDGDMSNEWKRNLVVAAETARMKGSIPGGLEEMIEDLLYPKLHWKEVIRKYWTSKAREKYQWIPQDRRHIYRGLYLPSLRGNKAEAALAMDSSGSISTKDMASFLATGVSLMEDFGEFTLYVFMCDCAIQGEWVVHNSDELPRVAKGRGGTSFIPVFERMKELGIYHLPLIYCTDLCGDFPSEAKDDTYWVVPPDAMQYEAPFGIKVERVEPK